MNTIRLLIADDHLLLRDGISAIVQECGGIDVVGQAQDGAEAQEKVETLQPDVVLMDIAMPIMDGPAATRQIKASWPHIRVLGLSMYDEPEYILDLMRAGASGFVLKDVSANELLRAIVTVHENGFYFSAGVASQVLFPAQDAAVNSDTTSALTAREIDVIKLIAKGMCNKEIASHLQISIRTVETHRQNLRNKLGIQSAAGLMRYALEHHAQ